MKKHRRGVVLSLLGVFGLFALGLPPDRWVEFSVCAVHTCRIGYSRPATTTGV